MKNTVQNVLQFIGNMDATDWLLTTAVVIALGFICMKGSGSRANY